MFDNEYFDLIYPTVILVFLAVMLVAIVLWFIYFIANDSHGSRKLVPPAFLIYGIASVLIGLWVFIYILFLYKKNQIYNKEYGYKETRDEDGEKSAE